MKDRIKLVRKEAKETQLIFAEKLNVSKSTIEAIEYGRREATDRTVSDICRIYNVNEDWIRTGKGDMFKPLDRAEEVQRIATRLLKAEPNDVYAKWVKNLALLSQEELVMLDNVIKKLVKEEKDSSNN